MRMPLTSTRGSLPMRAIIAFLAVMAIAACGSQRAVKFEQVYSGANGPRQVGAQYFSTLVELDNSWVKYSLNGAAYRKLLAQLDFSKQVLVAFSAGEINSFSGRIQIADVYQYTGTKDLPINLRVKVGVLKSECKVNNISLPFVLAVIERPVGFQPAGGFDVAIFEDGCRRAA